MYPLNFNINSKIQDINPPHSILEKYLLFSFTLSIIGYFLFFRILITDYESIMLYLATGSILGLKSILNESAIPGITTMVQFGIPTCILSIILFFNKKKNIYLFFIATIFVLALFRSFIFSERLAIIEIMIPIIVLLANYSKRFFYRSLIIGMLVFVLVWSSEIFRSYSSSINYENIEPLSYLTNRLLMYFSTSINNSLILFDYFKVNNFGEPILSPFLQFFNDSLDYQNQANFLFNYYGNPEFNNPTFFGVLYMSFGFYLFPFIILISSIVRLVYNLFNENKFIGLYLFPIIMCAMMDIRINYLLSIRVFYSYFLLFIIIIHSLYIYKFQNK